MLAINKPILKKTQRISIWLIGVSFVLFQFFLQLSSGVVIGALMHEMKFSALEAGILSSAFYYIYASLQIPVGLLFDRKSARLLLAVNALLCSFGCLFFAHSYSLLFLFIGRLLIGAGSAFAFVGLSHLLRQHFPLKQFGFLIGLSETLGFMVTVAGTISMGALIDLWGWRAFLDGAVILGILISYLCWRYIPRELENNPEQLKPITQYSHQLLTILKNRNAWFNGLFVGLGFTVITVFGAMWAVPFIQIKLHCSLQEASLIDSMVFLGAALSCPLFGKLASLFSRRRPLMVSSCLSTAILLVLALYLPISSAIMLALLMFLIGACCGSYMLAFSIANELAPAESLSTCTGFTNTLAMLTAPLMQPFIGYLLDLFTRNEQSYSLADYQYALLIIPISLFVAGGLSLLLPEKNKLNPHFEPVNEQVLLQA